MFFLLELLILATVVWFFFWARNFRKEYRDDVDSIKTQVSKFAFLTYDKLVEGELKEKLKDEKTRYAQLEEELHNEKTRSTQLQYEVERLNGKIMEHYTTIEVKNPWEKWCEVGSHT
jgi:hypothetical protein